MDSPIVGSGIGETRTPTRARHRVAVVIGVVAGSLAVASALHLSGQVQGRSAPFDADHAGIAEALLCVVLAIGATALWRGGPQARLIGLGTTGFTIAGFCWGLNVTARGGHWPDIAYHLAGLPLLIGGFTVLLREHRPAPADRAG
jgi:hypothetical protein